MTTPDPEISDALNALLEDERASVEIEVALASDATEYLEREALSAMGGEDTAVCCALREYMARADIPVSRRVHGVVFQVLGMERYDDRLRAFAHHQRLVADRAETLAHLDIAREVRRLLAEIRDAHARHAIWCETRANEFAASAVDLPGVYGEPGRSGPHAAPLAPRTESIAGRPGGAVVAPTDVGTPTGASGVAAEAMPGAVPDAGASAPEGPGTGGRPPATPPETTLT